jgi:CheY-like chemotaxis protein
MLLETESLRGRGGAEERKVLLVGLPQALDVTLADHLSRSGWTVYRAADGRDALQRWGEVGAPAVVTDLDGGGADAFDLFELSDVKPPPQVVLCTPHPLAEHLDARTLSHLGIAAVLRMPCAPATIARALEALSPVAGRALQVG